MESLNGSKAAARQDTAYITYSHPPFRAIPILIPRGAFPHRRAKTSLGKQGIKGRMAGFRVQWRLIFCRGWF